MTQKIKKIGIAIISTLLFCFVACKKEPKNAEIIAPNLPAQPYQYSNLDNNKATLGRVLFYDKHLSANNSVSCGTCHIQSLAFADGKQFSAGVAGKLTNRNTPGISSKSELNGLFWDARAKNFKDLALKPVVNHEEMGVIDLKSLPTEIATLPYYLPLFKNAYMSEEITIEKIEECIAEFLKALKRPNESKFELGNNNNKFSNFNQLELIGKEIYENKGNCVSCHNLSNSFSWVQTENIGLEMDYKDNGIQNGIFRVPNLYNIEFTAPYMHDGRFNSLEEVVEHYNSGIKNHPFLSLGLRQEQFNTKGDFIGTIPLKLNLTELEKKGLVAFLKTLSDPKFTTDIRYSNPFMK